MVFSFDSVSGASAICVHDPCCSCGRPDQAGEIRPPNRRDLPVDEWRRSTRGAQTRTLQRVPVRRFPGVGKHRKAHENNGFEIAFEGFPASRRPKPSAAETQLVPNRRGNRHLSVMLAQPLHDAGRRPHDSGWSPAGLGAGALLRSRPGNVRNARRFGRSAAFRSSTQLLYFRRSRSRAIVSGATRNKETAMPQVNFRVSSERLAFIDRAAAIRGVSRTEFVLRSSEAAAIEILNERPVIALDDEAWDDFIAALDAPVEIDPAVKARYARRPQWDR